MVVVTRMAPSLASVIRRVLASVPGEQMTLAEVVEGAQYLGYDYGPLCDGDDGRMLALTGRCLERLAESGHAVEGQSGNLRVWGRACPPELAAAVPQQPVTAVPAKPRGGTGKPSADSRPSPSAEPESVADGADAPWWPLTPANVFGLVFLVVVLAAFGLAVMFLAWWADHPH